VPARPLRPRPLQFAALALALCALAAPAANGRAFAASSACGAATQAVVAGVDSSVLNDIYANELAGQEVTDDLGYITTDQNLITALSQDDAATTLRAVQKLVYHPGWHIVRLRVLDASNRVLADVGGPYVIAPVTGVLHSATGAVIGSFAMSVQDDVGVTKLENRFVGDPIGIYVDGRLVAHLGGASLPRTRPTASTLTLHGVTYQAVTQTYNAFPTGMLRAVLLVPPPAATTSAESCDTVRAGEFGHVAMRLTGLLGPVGQHYYGYAYWVHIYTDADVFVLNPGGAVLASSDGSDPTSLPLSGPVSYDGQSWLVFSFEPQPPARVYLLVPPS
jgi:hypothetical protein